MKKLFSSPDSMKVDMLKGMLDVAGILCEIRNEYVSQALPGAPFYSEIWIVNDEDFSKAATFLDTPAGPDIRST